MQPVFFQMGSFTVRWYGVMVALGFLVGIWTAARRAERNGLQGEAIVNLGLIAMIAGVAGARLLYVINNWSYFAYKPLEIVRIDHGGLVFYGGFIGAGLSMVAYAILKKMPVGAYADVLAPSLALGHAFGRVGCFLNGCCFGTICDLPWAVQFPPGSDVFAHQLHHGDIAAAATTTLPVHPAQLYEAVSLLALSLVLGWFYGRRWYVNRLMWVYMGLYGALRFTLEFFRADEPHDILGALSGAQVLALVMIAVAIGGILWRKPNKLRPQEQMA